MLKNKLFTVSLLCFALTQSLSAQEKTDYSMAEIYDAMCIECHSAKGEGNPDKLTPSMSNFTQEEMELALKDVENEDGSVIMEHNREKILEKGMKYSAKDMAEYMYQRFNQ